MNIKFSSDLDQMEDEEIVFQSEMELKDHFAGLAMQSIMKDWVNQGFDCFLEDNPDIIANQAYLMAEAMMRNR